MRTVAPVVAVVALLSASPGSAQEDKDSPSGYMPLKVGARWVYATNYEQDITYELTGKEKVGEVECFVLEIRSMGRVIRRSWLAPSKEGAIIHRLQQGSTVLDVAKPFPKVPAVIQKDREWEGDAASKEKKREAHLHFRAEEKGDVKVPSGTYSAWKVRTTSRQGEFHFVEGHEWFARGVGMVKKELTFHVGNEPMKVVYELKEYREGK